MDYYSLFWGPRVISTINEPWAAFMCRLSTLAVLFDSDPFRGLLLIVLWSQSDFNGCGTPRRAYVLVVRTRSLGRFWPVSWTITQCFGVPQRFLLLTKPRVRLRVCRQHSQSMQILTRFMDYYSSILGSRSDFHDRQTLRCAYVWVINTYNFGRFWSIWCTITHRFLVPKQFPWLSNPKVCLRVGHQDSQFGPILARIWTITHCIGVPE